MIKNNSQRRLRAIFMACAMLLLGVFFIGSVSAGLWDNGLVSYYKLDESSGTVIDIHGTNNGTNFGATTGVSGKINTAYDFETTEKDGIYLNSSIGITDELSISAWIKLESNIPSGAQYVITAKDSVAVRAWTFEVCRNSGSNNLCYINGPAGPISDTTTNLTAGVWYNVVVTFKDSTNDLRLFVNGVNTFNASDTSTADTGNSLITIGQKQYGTAEAYFDGLIDEGGFWNRTLTQAEITQLYNSGSGLAYGSEGALPPTILVNLTSPVDYYNTTASQVIFNVSALVLSGGQTIQNVSLYFDGILNETNTSQTNGTYIFTKYISSGTHNWSILAFNNNSISTQSATRNLTFGIFENSRTFSASKTEGTSGTFVLNLSVVSPVTLAYLNYNGTLKATNIFAGAFTTLTSTFTIPTVFENTNVSFFWIVYTALQNFNSTTSNQTILNVAIDNCTVNKIVLYNFTIVDEITQTKLVGSTGNTSGKINIQVYPFANYNAIFTNYSTFFNMTNPFAICVNSTLSAGDKFSIDAQIEYDALLNTKEYYYIQNDTLEPSYLNKNITLYDLDDTKAQTFKIVYLDSSGIPVEDALIEIQRQYVDEGVFKIVEIAKTDKDGETQAKLQLNDVVYTFVVKKYGRVIDTFNKKFVRCDNYVYNVCEIKLNSFSSYIQTEDYTKGDDFEFTLTYTRATRTITSVFNIPSGSSSLIVLNATLLDNLGTTLACSSSITSSSGTLNCVVPNAIGNGTVYAQIFKDGVLQGSGDVSLNTKASDIYGASLVFLLIFLYLTLIGMGVGDSPMVMGVFMILGVILAVALNLVDTGASKFFGAGATILWFIIAVVIVLIKGGKR